MTYNLKTYNEILTTEIQKMGRSTFGVFLIYYTDTNIQPCLQPYIGFLGYVYHLMITDIDNKSTEYKYHITSINDHLILIIIISINVLRSYYTIMDSGIL